MSADKTSTPDEIRKENEILRNKLKELDGKNAELKEELKEASGVVKNLNDERYSVELGEKIALSIELSDASLGLYRRGNLERLNIDTLRGLKRLFEDETQKVFREFLAKRRADLDAGRRRSGLTVGEYDPDRKEWDDT